MGTNNIKYFRKDNAMDKRATPGNTTIFYKSLINIIKSLRYHFGKGVHIYFQSVLLMKAMYA